VSGVGGELAVSADGSDMTVDVATGEAWIQGNYYASDAVETLTLEDANATKPRIDLVVLRNDINGARKITLAVITGEAASTPVAPDHLTSADFYDLVIAQVAVAANAAVISSGNITSTRSNTTLCGITSPRSVRYADLLSAGSPFAMAGFRLTGVTTPTANADGVNLAYRDSRALTDPVGAVDDFAGLTIPAGWLECNGALISRTTYSALFTAIGTTFGAGDGSTTFALPSIKGVSVVGYKSGDSDFGTLNQQGGVKTVAITETTMAAHTHAGTYTATITQGPTDNNWSNYHSGYGHKTNGSGTGSAGSGTAHNNLPPYLVLKKIIKAVA
jgi:microcystin-dependent protein